MLINIMFMLNNRVWTHSITSGYVKLKMMYHAYLEMLTVLVWTNKRFEIWHIQSTSLLQKLLPYCCLDLHLCIIQHFIYFLVLVKLTEIRVLHQFPDSSCFLTLASNSRERSLTDTSTTICSSAYSQISHLSPSLGAILWTRKVYKCATWGIDWL